MLANGYRMCIWSHGCDQRLLSRVVSRESQNRLYFGVEWEVLGILQGDGAAVGVELVVSLFVSLELLGNAKNILLEKAGRVDQHHTVLFGFDSEPSENRFSE